MKIVHQGPWLARVCEAFFCEKGARLERSFQEITLAQKPTYLRAREPNDKL